MVTMTYAEAAKQAVAEVVEAVAVQGPRHAGGIFEHTRTARDLTSRL